MPALAAICLYKLLKIELKAPEFGTLWSIECEIIYYLIYPIIFYLRKYTQLNIIIIITYVISTIILLLNLDILAKEHNGYPALGITLTWLIGLPCWLLGCWLAENFSKFKALSFSKIWALRFSIVFIVLILHIIKFHLHHIIASNCFTLNAFAILGCIWLGFEIVYYLHQEPNTVLEGLGKWSYSLYLFHPIVGDLLVYLKLVNFKYQHMLIILSCFIVSYIFYLVIEKPSHKLAVFLSSKVV